MSHVRLLFILCSLPSLVLAGLYERAGTLQIYRTIDKVIYAKGSELTVAPGGVFDYGLVVANRRDASSLGAFELRETLPFGTEYSGPSALKPWPRSVAGRLLRLEGRDLVFEVGALKPGATSTLFVQLRRSTETVTEQPEQDANQAKVQPKTTATPPPVPEGKSLVAGLSADRQSVVVGLRIPEAGTYWLKARNMAGELILQKDLGHQSSGPLAEMLRIAHLAPGIYLLTLERDGTNRPTATFKLMVPR